jgi:CubicO group peptidase (beta-lactamase class C family)
VGAAVCAYVAGRKVVDLWGGWADAARTRAWGADTIVDLFSATKGMTATCAHRLVDRGLLDVDEPVATYWPEFAAAGKAHVPVRMLLNHQAGLAAPRGPFPADVPVFDWAARTAWLAGQAPTWEPGTRCEYHGGTFGWLVGEVVRRIDGRPLPTFFREEVAVPLGADLLLAAGPEDDHRCAEMSGPDEMVGGGNSRRWRRAGEGSATGLGTAAGLARLYAALALGGALDGVPVLGAGTIGAATQEQPLVGADGDPGDFGLGFQLLWKVYPGLAKGTFGHTGLGGSIGLADPRRRLGFGYVMNRMPSDGATELLIALYRSLAA